MDSQEIKQPQNHQVVMNRFVAACQADERVLPAFLHGSYVKGTVDAYCDLDLGLITTDEAYVDFYAGREAFIRLLGEPVFLEDFGATLTLLFIQAWSQLPTASAASVGGTQTPRTSNQSDSTTNDNTSSMTTANWGGSAQRMTIDQHDKE
jgi:hypothetical protein